MNAPFKTGDRVRPKADQIGPRGERLGIRSLAFAETYIVEETTEPTTRDPEQRVRVRLASNPDGPLVPGSYYACRFVKVKSAAEVWTDPVFAVGDLVTPVKTPKDHTGKDTYRIAVLKVGQTYRVSRVFPDGKVETEDVLTGTKYGAGHFPGRFEKASPAAYQPPVFLLNETVMLADEQKNDLGAVVTHTPFGLVKGRVYRVAYIYPNGRIGVLDTETNVTHGVRPYGDGYYASRFVKTGPKAEALPATSTPPVVPKKTVIEPPEIVVVTVETLKPGTLFRFYEAGPVYLRVTDGIVHVNSGKLTPLSLEKTAIAYPIARAKIVPE